MELGQQGAQVFALDSTPLATALGRTTHLGVGAHADDLEIMAAHGILECLGRSDRWFSGVIVTSGVGGPRAPGYAQLSDPEMAEVRRAEQRRAATLGEYSALALLDYPSSALKRGSPALLADLRSLLSETRPDVVYTHNLADAHESHVAVALRLIEACRALPAELRPRRVLGCEVWRDLDWLCDEDRVRLRVDGHDALLASLVAAHESQLASGKRYDLAALGRQRAHATFAESHAADDAAGLNFAMDLTPLIHGGEPSELTRALLDRFQRDVLARIARLG